MLNTESRVDYYKGLIYKEILLLLNDVTESRIKQAMEYMLLGAGKRIRPILAIGTVEMLGGNPEKIIKVAACLEILHTYSLIHDDLPAMDNDIERRGMPTCHIKFDEATAILAGDALLNLVFEVISSDNNLSNKQKVSLIKIISTSSGANGMILGQIMDIQFQEIEYNLDDMIKMHKLKTGALFVACFTVGGVLSNANKKTFSLLQDFGENFGSLFQIVDDIDDISNEYEANIVNSTNYEKAIEIAKSNHSNAYKILAELNIGNDSIPQYMLDLLCKKIDLK